MKEWIEPPNIVIPENYRASIGVHPIVSEILFRRGITDIDNAKAFLEPQNFQPVPPIELPGVERAVERIFQAIENEELICVWGDFDVDGQTATTLLVSVLRELNARVMYHIPVRANESHGISAPVLSNLLIKNPIKLLLTCDTGISADEAIKLASDRKVDVIITDHHELPVKLPEANAIVSTRLLDKDHKLSSLPGVGIAFKLAQELLLRADKRDLEGEYLDLVALGIVADLAQLTGETRYLLQQGLARLRNPQRLGIRAMMEIAELSPDYLTEEHVGFILAPRLNAIGRLADANPIVEFLLTNDINIIRIVAQQLEGYNARRQLLTNQVFQGAITQIEKDLKVLDAPVLVLSNSTWSPGVIGIVANRLVEQFHKPVILISTEGGEVGRGSARSVEGINITDAIATQKHILLSYGGHAMAAGFNLQAERIIDFQQGLSQEMSKYPPVPKQLISIDGYLSFSDLSLELATELERLAPFGPGNPPLVFVNRGVKVIKTVDVGRQKEHLLLTVESDAGISYEVIWWHGADVSLGKSYLDSTIDLAYNMRSSSYKGQHVLQIEWIDYSLPDNREVVIKTPFEAIDYRNKNQPSSILERCEQGDIVWVEAQTKEQLTRLRSLSMGLQFLGRNEIRETHTLVIWTTPPGRRELVEVIEKSQPGKVVIVGIDPNLDSWDRFIRRLAGLIKYSVKAYDGKLNINKISEAIAHRVITVKKSIEWLGETGYLEIINKNPDEYQVRLIKNNIPDHEKTEEQKQLRSMIDLLLAETASFRKYFLRAKIDDLIP